jgi:hypothetical protein
LGGGITGTAAMMNNWLALGAHAHAAGWEFRGG